MHCNHTPEEIAKRIAALPEPLRKKPKNGIRYYYHTTIGYVRKCVWANDETDNKCLHSSACFATEQDAQAHVNFRKWLYEKQKLTLAQCWEQADENDSMAPPAAKAKEFLRLARENSLI